MNKWIVVFFALVGCSGSRSRLDSPPPSSCDLPRTTLGIYDGGHCPDLSCGTNSPVINGFPFNGLNQKGCANADGVALIPGSFDRGLGRCPSGPLTLGFARVEDLKDASKGYELVARSQQGSIVCRGAKLAGATFAVRVHDGRTVSLVISHVTKVPLDGKPDQSRLVYLIDPSSDLTTSLCAQPVPPEAYNHPGKIEGTLAMDGSDGPSTSNVIELADYAVIVPGPLYDPMAHVIDGSKAAGWFSIACAGDALGETELSGLLERESSSEDRLTLLHMFAAKYRDGFSATVRGTPIAWTGRGIHSRSYQPGLLPEAQWDAEGAGCLSHSRMWLRNRVVPVLKDLDLHFGTAPKPTDEQTFVNMFGKPKCGDVKADEMTLTSYVLDHIDK